jgi:ferredoxin-NADP reductase
MNNTRSFSVKFIKKYRIAEDTLALQFEKPRNFQFTPGQFVRITLINPKETDERSNSRSFSIASAPHEKQLLFALLLFLIDIFLNEQV